MGRYKLTFIIGIFLIIIGIFVPSSLLISFLRAAPSEDLETQLILGATLFKVGLVIFGFLVLVLNKLPIVWKPEIKKLESTSNHNKKLIIASVTIILIISFAIRLYGLSFGLWFDEIMTYVKYANMPYGKIITTYDSQNNHILYSLLAHSSFQIFGESDFALRLPAVLFGVASIWAIYLLGSEVSTRREALLSAVLLAFSYHHIWFSQNARGYTGLLFWTLLSSWLLLRGIREGWPRLWLLYAITIAFGAYTHMTMSFVVIGHFIIYILTLLLSRRENLWNRVRISFFLGFCLAGLFTVQFYALVLPQVFGKALWIGVESTVMDWKNPLWTILLLAKGMKIGFARYSVAIVAFFIFGTGLFSFIRNKPVIVLLFLIPTLLATTVMMLMGHPLFPRTFFFAMGFGVLIIIRGTMVLGYLVGNLFRLSPSRSNLIGVVLCAGLIIVSAMSVPKAYAPKQDYSGALKFVEERKEPGDIIVTVGVVATAPYNSLYNVDWEEAETLEELNSIRNRAKRTWLVYTMPLYLQSEYPEIMSNIKSDFKIEKQFYGTLGDGTIVVCRSDNTSFLFPTRVYNKY